MAVHFNRQESAEPLGKRRWAIPEGFIPESSTGPQPQMTSHGTLCVLNTSSEPARLELRIFFSDREPAGPYRAEVGPQRTLHLRFNELEDPEPIPRGVDFASVLEASIPVVVQHTRLDSRQSENALMTTMAFGGD